MVQANGKPKVFLPPDYATSFTTVAQSVCVTAKSREFLSALGLAEPSPVDDVVLNVLPKYTGNSKLDIANYDSDIARILNAFEAANDSQRKDLVCNLRDANFVRAKNAGEASATRWRPPQKTYLPTDELKQLFDGVWGVWFADETCEYLRDERVYKLLEACGAGRNLKSISFDNKTRFNEKQLEELRNGLSSTTKHTKIDDWEIMGLKQLLNHLPKLTPECRVRRAEVLWSALAKLESTCFSGTYWWFYVKNRSCTFPSEFVELLNNTAWVPCQDGTVKHPRSVIFGELGWPENKLLLDVIQFMPSAVTKLARAAGFDPRLLELIKELGLTAESVRLKFLEESRQESDHTLSNNIEAT